MEVNVVKNLRHILQRIQSAVSVSKAIPSSLAVDEPRLVAVSKTFPTDLVKACYEEGQRHFGENYVQELIEKAKNLQDTCPEIQWHFIGRLQSTHINKIAAIPNLWCVETIASEKHARLFQKACSLLKTRLNVFIQVNTSGEENKGGAEEVEAPKIAEYIVGECPNLELLGLMTIGSIVESKSREENADFQKLREIRAIVANKLGKNEMELELSMGMSQDFELAIQYGSTNLRIGSTIFGARN